MDAVRTGPESGWLLTTTGLSHTDDAGATWTTTPITSPLSTVRPFGQLFVDGSSAWLANVTAAGLATVTRVDAGRAPITATLAGSYPNAHAVVAMADAVHGWASVVTNSQTATLYGTADGGRSWHSLGPAPVAGPIHPLDATHVVALGPQLVRSDDAGATWRAELAPHPESGGLPASFAALSLFGGRGVLQVDIPTGMMGYAVFDVTDDGGRTWASRRAPDDALFAGTGAPLTLAVTDPDRWHIAVGQRIWATTDTGRSWQEVPTDVPAGMFHAYSASSFDQAWAVVSTVGGNLPLTTDDGGRHWATLPLPPS